MKKRSFFAHFLAALLIAAQPAWGLPAPAQDALRALQESEAAASGLEEAFASGNQPVSRYRIPDDGQKRRQYKKDYGGLQGRKRLTDEQADHLKEFIQTRLVDPGRVQSDPEMRGFLEGLIQEQGKDGLSPRQRIQERVRTDEGAYLQAMGTAGEDPETGRQVISIAEELLEEGLKAARNGFFQDDAVELLVEVIVHEFNHVLDAEKGRLRELLDEIDRLPIPRPSADGIREQLRYAVIESSAIFRTGQAAFGATYAPDPSNLLEGAANCHYANGKSVPYAVGVRLAIGGKPAAAVADNTPYQQYLLDVKQVLRRISGSSAGLEEDRDPGRGIPANDDYSVLEATADFLMEEPGLVVPDSGDGFSDPGIIRDVLLGFLKGEKAYPVALSELSRLLKADEDEVLQPLLLSAWITAEKKEGYSVARQAVTTALEHDSGYLLAGEFPRAAETFRRAERLVKTLGISYDPDPMIRSVEAARRQLEFDDEERLRSFLATVGSDYEYSALALLVTPGSSWRVEVEDAARYIRELALQKEIGLQGPDSSPTPLPLGFLKIHLERAIAEMEPANDLFGKSIPEEDSMDRGIWAMRINVIAVGAALFSLVIRETLADVSGNTSDFYVNLQDSTLRHTQRLVNQDLQEVIAKVPSYQLWNAGLLTPYFQQEAGLEEGELARAVADPAVRALLGDQGFAPVRGGYIAEAAPLPGDRALVLQAGLEEPAGLPAGLPVVRADETTVAGMLGFLGRLAEERGYDVAFSAEYMSLTDAQAAVPLTTPGREPPGSVLLKSGVKVTARDLGTAFMISRRTGALYVIGVIEFTSPDWERPLIYIRTQV